MTDLTGGQGRGKVENFPGNDEILLGVLTAVDQNGSISQRSMSRELGVALGLANAYLKRCVNKGWVKVQHVPRKRYVYYLTPKGFTEKARLTSQYLSASFTFFRRAREQMSELIAHCDKQGWRRIAFAGRSELVDVGLLCTHECKVEILGVIDPASAGGRYHGLPVVAALAELDSVDAVIITDMTAPHATLRSIAPHIEAQRILSPRLLRIALPHLDAEPQPPKAVGR